MCLEAMSHERNSFVTLTYDEKNHPRDGSLNPEDVTRFLKRFRKRIDPGRVRYYLVGEYGDVSWRPHYHIAFFGQGVERLGEIEESWPYGFVSVGDLNAKSASYICGYVIKKLTKPDDPRLEGKYPEFARMSRNPGIGVPAIEGIREQLQRTDGLGERFFTEDGDVPTSLGLDDKTFPLGRFLRQKLRDVIDLDEIVTRDGEVLYKGKEAQKERMAKELLDVWKNPEDPKVTADARASLKHFFQETHKQYIRNIENRAKITFKEKKL
jgi:hypothetical protein